MEPVQLAVMPSCLDCLRISADAEIAIGAGEYVHILTPTPAKITSDRTQQQQSTTARPDNLKLEDEDSATQDSKDESDLYLERPNLSNPYSPFNPAPEPPLHFSQTRLRANLFTSTEWPLLQPMDSRIWSPGEEISDSEVVSAPLWSPGGLIGRTGGCALGVLTGNWLLSIWEPVGVVEEEEEDLGEGKGRGNGERRSGQVTGNGESLGKDADGGGDDDGEAKGTGGKSGAGDNLTKGWRRSIIINHTIQRRFDAMGITAEEKAVRQRLRAFCWSPALNCPATAPVQASLKNWRMVFMAVANEAGEIFLLSVGNNSGRTEARSKDSGVWDVRLLASLSLKEAIETKLYSQIMPGSLFANALQQIYVAGHLAWSPWVYPASFAEESVLAYSWIAVEHRRKLRLFVVKAKMGLLESTTTDGRELDGLEVEEVNLAQVRSSSFSGVISEIEGPVVWREEQVDGQMTLVAGIGGILQVVNFDVEVLLKLSTGDQGSSVQDLNSCSTCEIPLTQDIGSSGSWEMLSGLLVENDSTSKMTRFHLSTYGGYLSSFVIDTKLSTAADPKIKMVRLQARSQIAEALSRFEEAIDDPGRIRVWGLHSHEGWTVTCVTLHPDSMIEYPMQTDDRLWLFFSPPANAELRKKSPFVVEKPNAAQLAESRRNLLLYILSLPLAIEETDAYKDAKIIYAACCAALSHYSLDTELMPLVNTALCFLRDTFSLDLSHELTLVSGGAPEIALKGQTVPIPPRQATDIQLMGRAAEILDTCDICGDSFMFWGEIDWAWCGNRHPATRCGMTFLAIQDPRDVRECAICKTKFLVEGKVDGISTTWTSIGAQFLKGKVNSTADETKRSAVGRRLLDMYNACPYCGGRFKF